MNTPIYIDDTLFYTLSTIPQVLIGAIAIVGVFVIFKVEIVRKQLLGHGENILKHYNHYKTSKQLRKKRQAVYYEAFNKRPDENMETRIGGAILTSDLKYLGELINKIADIEKEMFKNGRIPQLDPNGFSVLAENYITIFQYYNSLKKWALGSAIFSAFAILVSLFCLMIVKNIINNYPIFVLIFNIILASIAVLLTLFVVYKALK